MGSYQKYVFSGILIFLVVVLGLWFVLAAPVILPQDIHANESVEYKFNISVNNTDPGAPANITQVNITIPSNFTTFIAGTNGTESVATFTNSTTANNFTLSWTNTTFVINGTSPGGPGEKKHFWFNATVTPGTYNITVTTVNDTGSYTLEIPVRINDTTFPLISYGLNTESNNANKSQNWIYVNVSVTELFPENISFLVWNLTGPWDNLTTYTMADQTSNTTINWTGLVDGHYSYNVSIHDTQGNTNNSIGTRNITLDTTDPIAIVSCSQTTVYSGSSFPCTCSGTDDGATASGVSTETGSSTSSDGTSTPTSTGTFTYTCTVTDNAGNSASATTTYTVLRSRGSSAVTTPSLPKKTHSWTKITPGVVTIMKDFDSEIGIRQIQIDVNNPAQNVKITVTKHDGKPAEVSVEKTGKVYQYLQIGAENFDNTLDKATVEFRVERSWAAGVGLGKNDIAVFRYNEAASRWDELTTTSTREDATYYYYDVELDEFSYFAISEKAVVTEEEPVLGVEKSKTWLWILVAVAIIAIIVWQMKIKKK